MRESSESTYSLAKCLVLFITINCISLLTFQFSQAQTSTYTSSGLGVTWTDPASWNCTGVCGGAGIPTSLTDHAVVIRHAITTTGAIAAFSVRIENVANGQDAKLTISGTGNIAIGAGGLILNGTNGLGGNTEFAVTGSGASVIGGNTVILQNKNSGAFTKFRIGGGGVSSTASVTINGNLNMSYLNSSVATPETEPEINLGSTVGDQVALTINGTTLMNYNFNDTGTSNNNLAINVDNSSSISFNGNVNMFMTNGGSHGRARITLEGDATATITGTTSLFYSDDNNGTELSLELGTQTNQANSAEFLVNHLTMSSTNNTSSNNSVKAFGNGLFRIGGNITFIHSGAGTTPSLENHIEANGNSTIEMRGSITNPTRGSLEFVDAGTTARFSGAVAQTIPTNLRTTLNYQNIEIDNLAGVSLNAPVTADGNVILTRGILSTTTGNILTLTEAATTTGGSMTSYIDGPVKKTCGSGNCSDTFFQLGDDNLWAPLNISNVIGESAATTFTVQYIKDPFLPGNTDGTFDHRSGFEHWLINVTGAIPTASLAFHWKDACASEIEDADPTTPTLFMGWFDVIDSRWEKLSASVIDASSDDCDPGGGNEEGFITVPSVGSFGAFTFISEGPFDNPLPVEIVNFEVTINHDEVDILWQTASETQNDFFTVQRTQNMQLWEVIDTVRGHGTTNTEKNYATVDSNPLVGLNYYRLCQHDFDGSFTYSVINSVNISAGTTKFHLEVYPNPINPEINELVLKSSSGLRGSLLVKIIGVDGIVRKVVVIESTENLMSLHFADLEDGLYLLKIKSSTGLFENKIRISKDSSR